jgi:hypothetical protein
MTEWIEIPKKSGGEYEIPADKVALRFLKGPGGGVYLRVQIGHAVARKLGWSKETRARLFWSAIGDKLKLDIAPPGHGNSYAFRSNKKATRLTLTASVFPESVTPTPGPRVIADHEAIVDPAVRGINCLIVTLPKPTVAAAPARRRA